MPRPGADFAFTLYASALSGFYLPLMVLVWLLILRGIAIEFRNHIQKAAVLGRCVLGFEHTSGDLVRRSAGKRGPRRAPRSVG